MKRCIGCGEQKPATPEFFYGHRKTGLQSRCKQCDVTRSTSRSKHVVDPGHQPRRRACPVCEGMPWRRFDAAGNPGPCVGCHAPFALERRAVATDFAEDRKDMSRI